MQTSDLPNIARVDSSAAVKNLNAALPFVCPEILYLDLTRNYAAFLNGLRCETALGFLEDDPQMIAIDVEMNKNDKSAKEAWFNALHLRKAKYSFFLCMCDVTHDFREAAGPDHTVTLLLYRARDEDFATWSVLFCDSNAFAPTGRKVLPLYPEPFFKSREGRSLEVRYLVPRLEKLMLVHLSGIFVFSAADVQRYCFTLPKGHANRAGVCFLGLCVDLLLLLACVDKSAHKIRDGEKLTLFFVRLMQRLRQDRADFPNLVRKILLSTQKLQCPMSWEDVDVALKARDVPDAIHRSKAGGYILRVWRRRKREGQAVSRQP